MRQSDEPLSFVTKAPLERLLPHARPCQFCKGAVICTGEELLEGVYFILSGSCELRGTLDGHEEVVETFGPGAAFGGWERGTPDEPGTRAVAAADSVLLSLSRAKTSSCCGRKMAIRGGVMAMPTPIQPN